MSNDHWKTSWDAVPECSRADLEQRLAPDLPVEIVAKMALPENAMFLPNTNPPSLSPQEIVEQGYIIVARVEAWWNGWRCGLKRGKHDA